MLDRLRGSRPTLDADRLKSQAADVGARLSDVTARAGLTAEQLAAQAKEAAYQAKDWAAPRAEKAWYEGRKAAAPKIEAAAEKAIPVVDTAHDRLVDDILPKLVAAITAAAGAAAVGADKARDVADAKLTELAHIAPPPKKHTGAKVFWSIAGLAIVGAVVAAFRRRQPAADPWAEEPWDETDAVESSMAAALDEVPAPSEVGDEAIAVAERGLETAEAEARAAAEATGSTGVTESTEKLAEAEAEVMPKPRRTRAPKPAADDAAAPEGDAKPAAARRRTPAKPKPDADTPTGDGAPAE